MMSNYLKILEESLIKKNDILNRLQALSDEQFMILNTTPMSLEEFDKRVEDKDVLVKELVKLDEGFDVLYENVKAELKDNKAKYADSIQKMKQQIQLIMDKSVAIQAQESRNKEMLTAYFKKEKQAVGESRRTAKAAYDYYKRVSNVAGMPPQYMDQKK